MKSLLPKTLLSEPKAQGRRKNDLQNQKMGSGTAELGYQILVFRLGSSKGDGHMKKMCEEAEEIMTERFGKEENHRYAGSLLSVGKKQEVGIEQQSV